MTNKKSTKRALLLSALSLLLCVSMLVGSTFAWFTDSVTSAGNTIQSGTLKVDLVDDSDNSVEGEVIKFVAADGRDNILWEPGCTYETEPVYVVNEGNLALKYQIVINGIDGNAKLLEAIEWTVTVDGIATELADLKGHLLAGETSKAIVLSGHMKEEAGNEYQGLTAEGISIAVFATQLTSEFDSFTDQYDAAAEYAADTMLKNVAAVAAGESATVKLESDGYVVLDGQNLIGAKVVGDVTLDLNGKTLFVKAEDVDGHQSLFNIIKGGKLTVTGNGTIEMVSGKNESKVTAIFNNTAGTLVIENGTYKMDVKTYAQGSMIPTIVDTNSSGAAATTTINGGNFYHTRNMFRNFPGVRSELTINGGTFNGKADDWAAVWNQKPGSSAEGYITVNGGTFNYVEINDECGGKVTINNNVVVPVPVSSADELQAALANGGEVVLTADVVLGQKVNIPAGKEVTLDLSGHKLAGAFDNQGGSALIDNSGSLTVKNGTIVSLAEHPDVDWGTEGFPAYATNTISNKGVLVIEDSAVIENQTAVGGASYAIDNYAGATLTVNGGTIKAQDVAIRMFSGSATSENKVVINGGTITGKRAVWVQLPSNNSAVAPKTTLEINGGELTGISNLAIYSYSYGNSFANTNVTITGGTFNGDVAFGGGYKGDQEKVSVTGGTFNAKLGRYLENDGWVDITKS